MADDAAPLMHVDWLRTFEAWRQELQTPIEINVEQIIGGGQPLTGVNDINITVSLTGTPLTALLKPVTLTFAWAGTLAPSRGGLGFDASGVAKGGLIVGAAANTFGIKTVGADGTVFTADSTIAGGVRWGTPTSSFISTPMPILDSPEDSEGAWALAAAGSPARVVTVTGPTGPTGPAGLDGADPGDDLWASAMAHSAAWGALPISDDTTTNATMYPTWVSAASGALPLKVSSTKLTFNPSTGTLGTQIVGFSGGSILSGTVANVLEVRNGATAQEIHVFNGYTDAANNSYLRLAAGAGFGIISTVQIGTGNISNGFELDANAGGPFLFKTGGITKVTILAAGQVGFQVSSPTAILHIKAGTSTASTAPLKFNSGTNLTTAEAGAVEYNGTNLFFTRAGTVRENVLVAIDNATAPTTSIGVAIVNFYGANATNYLGDPNRWLSVNVLGSTYKIPLYT